MAATFGTLGDTVQAFGEGHFATWFSFEPSDEVVAGGTLRYRPSGDAFRSLVSLTMTVDAAGTFEKLSLEVDRSFIDDARQSPFARDIVASFIRGVAGDDAAAWSAIADDITFRDMRTPVLSARPGPALAPEASPAYRVFAGEQASWSGPGKRVDLAMRLSERAALVIEATRRPTARGSGILGRIRALFSR